MLSWCLLAAALRQAPLVKPHVMQIIYYVYDNDGSIQLFTWIIIFGWPCAYIGAVLAHVTHGSLNARHTRKAAGYLQAALMQELTIARAHAKAACRRGDAGAESATLLPLFEMDQPPLRLHVLGLQHIRIRRLHSCR